MFGWLASFGVCERMRSTPSSHGWFRVSPQRLVRTLPSLGCVLHLSRPAALDPEVAGAWTSMLAEQPVLRPLLHTRWLQAASEVTVEGPREWIGCIDAAGETLARLYLLPDTDYLAWDALLAAADVAAGPALGPRRTPVFRASQARLLRFTCRRLACFDLLGGASPRGVSMLGQRLAGDIARAEAVPLHCPLVSG